MGVASAKAKQGSHSLVYPLTITITSYTSVTVIIYTTVILTI